MPAGDLNTKRKRDIEVQEKHGGSYKRWLEHTFRQERRDTPEHKLHELHARWFSLNPDEWYDKFREVDTAFNGPRRDINVSSAYQSISILAPTDKLGQIHFEPDRRDLGMWYHDVSCACCAAMLCQSSI